MAKLPKDIKREIYDFVEDISIETGEPVILQTILDKFCSKYKCSTTTITRYLDELVASRSPFRLKTWYDKNRYYSVPTMSLRFRICALLSIFASIFFFFVDLYELLPILLFEKILLLLIGFWICYTLNFIMEKNKKK